MTFSDSAALPGDPVGFPKQTTGSPALPTFSRHVGPSPKNLRDEFNAIITFLEPDECGESGGSGGRDIAGRPVQYGLLDCRDRIPPLEEDATSESPGGLLAPLGSVAIKDNIFVAGGANCDAAGLAQRADDPLVRQLVAESVPLHGDASLVTREREWVNTALARLTTRHGELYEQQQLDAIMMPVTPTLPPLVSEVLEERDDLGKRGYEAEDRLHVLPLERLWV